MRRREDYYRILQVHYLAEPEIIESAYRRLAKKYHPDVNKDGNSAEMMQKINQAYEELGNPVKRQQYNLEWEDIHNKPGESESFSAARSVLEEYFRNIMSSRFDLSYALISSIDKRNISKDDFINWQLAVSMVFHLKEYSCKICGMHRNKPLSGHIFSDIVEFRVEVVEYNAVMEMLVRDELIKTTVLEDGKWQVYAGYEDLQPLINKFKTLTGLLTAKSILNELEETHSRVDSLTGLPNQRGIIERIENEKLRFERYGNVFSLIICDVDIVKMPDISVEQEAKDHALKYIGGILLNLLRKLDVVGRWEQNSFLILLPETAGTFAVNVVQKIRSTLKTKRLIYNDNGYRISVTLRSVEYGISLEESLGRIGR